MTHLDRLVFGAAYYDEYTPASAGPDRLERDMEMMVEAGFTTIRIAAFPWGTRNPAPGASTYGARQNMDITAPAYRHYAEEAIRALAARTAPRTGVIGFQLDNETKYYDAAYTGVQRSFSSRLE